MTKNSAKIIAFNANLREEINSTLAKKTNKAECYEDIMKAINAITKSTALLNL
jgi:hypothetical protein